MRRIVHISDITATADKVKEPKGNQLYEHGGYGQGKESREILKRSGYILTSYEKGMEIKPDDVIWFSDREHFYKGWKFLKTSKYLCNTICLMIESGAVDKKCGKKDLWRIKNAFPVFQTYQDDLVDNRKFFKYCPSVNSSTIMEKRDILFSEMQLGAIVCTNKNPAWAVDSGELYSERRNIIAFFDEHTEYSFGLYGDGWGGKANYKGAVKSKTEIYSRYKFAFCLENIRANGYITEKIFDCFQKGIVPVYGGAFNIEKYIPADCFIDYFAFDNIESLVHYLDQMNEEVYHKYLDAIENFLRSNKFEYFRIERQMKRMCDIISVFPRYFKPSIQAQINMFVYIACYEFCRKMKIKVLSCTYNIKKRIPILKNIGILHRNRIDL